MGALFGAHAHRKQRHDAVRDALHLAERDVARVLDRATVRATGPNEVVIRAGDAADRMFVIVRGKFVVTVDDGDGRTRPVRMLGAGTYFGEMGLLDGTPRRASVLCGSDEGELLELTATDVRYLLDGAPAARSGLLAEAAERQEQLSRH